MKKLKNIEFIIGIGVGYGEILTGGVVALHKLAYEIANRGYKVNIFTSPVYPHENIYTQDRKKFVTPNLNLIENLDFNFDPKRTFIIPPFDWNNTQNYPNICRWVLHHLDDHIIRNVKSIDKIYNFGNFDLCGLKEDGKLTTLEYHKDLFKNENRTRNGKVCYLLNKYTPPYAEKILKLLNADSLQHWKQNGAFNFLKEKFNEYEYFVTFDSKTFHTLAAAMCGCKSIILQNELNPEVYRELNPLQKYGVAYGIDDLAHAEQTLNKVSEQVEFLIGEDNKTIDNFIKNCIETL
jgi:hypothetical protein